MMRHRTWPLSLLWRISKPCSAKPLGERSSGARSAEAFALLRAKNGLVVGVVIALSCGPTRQSSSGGAADDRFVPGLGELMSLQQMRHVKLWLAGEATNWDLASYEVDEISEGFDDIVKFHPTHKDSPVAPKDAIPRMVTQPLADVRAAISRKDATAFARAYDALTAACNNCHQATNFGFNRVKKPESNPYPNQEFAPPSQ